MVLSLSVLWRLVFAIALGAAIFASACARAPRRSIPSSELRQLVLCALGLYAVGVLASLTHHGVLAAAVYSVGIVIAALAAWLSRGRDQEDPPDADEPVQPPPPPEPDGMPRLDWETFERDFREYSDRVPGSSAPR